MDLLDFNYFASCHHCALSCFTAWDEFRNHPGPKSQDIVCWRSSSQITNRNRTFSTTNHDAISHPAVEGSCVSVCFADSQILVMNPIISGMSMLILSCLRWTSVWWHSCISWFIFYTRRKENRLRCNFFRMPFTFKNQYHWDETQTGFAFLGIGSGSLFGLYVVYVWSDRIAAALTKRHGIQKPEVDSPLRR